MRLTATIGREKAPLGAIGAILIAAAVIRWHNIGDYSLWLDEIGEAVVASEPLPTLLAGVRSHAAAGPLDYIAVHYVTAVLGDGTVQIRAWAFMTGVLGVAVTGLVARYVFNSWATAIVSAVAMALAPIHVFYAQEARFYASSVLFGLLIIAAFTAAARNGSVRSWATYGVAVAIGLYDHYFLGFIALAGFLACLLSAAVSQPSMDANGQWRPMRVLGVTAASVVALVLFSPWLLYSTAHQLSVTNPVTGLPFSIDGWVSAVVTLVSPGQFGIDPTPIAFTATGVVVVLATVGVITNQPLRRPEVGMLTILAALLVPTVWLANNLGGYRFAERQVIMLVPILLMLAAAGAVALVRKVRDAAPPWQQAVALALAAAVWSALMATPLSNVWDGSWRIKEDWRGAGVFIADNTCPGARIYVNVGAGYEYGLGIYQPQLAGRFAHLSSTPDRPLPLVVADTETNPNDWIVILRDAPNVFAPGVGGLDAISAHLGGRHYSKRDFTERLRVFIPPKTCPEGPH